MIRLASLLSTKMLPKPANCIVKNFGSKSLVNMDCRKFGRKLWQIEVHLHRERYGTSENW